MDSSNELFQSFITSGKPEGSSIINICDEGAVCIQFFIIPNIIDYKKMNIFLKPFTTFQKDFNLDCNTRFNNIVIPHEYQNEHTFGILSFSYNKDINSSLFITTTAESKGFYSKVNIEYL